MSVLDLCAVFHLPVHLAFRLLHRSQARETFFLFFPVRELRSGLMEGLLCRGGCNFGFGFPPLKHP